MSNLDDQLGGELDKTRADGLYRTLRTVASAQGPHIRIEGREFLNFSSNDYLGLANDPVLKQAATDAIEHAPAGGRPVDAALDADVGTGGAWCHGIWVVVLRIAFRPASVPSHCFNIISNAS